MQLEITKATEKKAMPDPQSMGFGKHFSDHMFIMDYTDKKGWHDPRILPYGPISLSPSSSVLHYGQALFEGMKAFKSADGRHIYLFRPEKNMERINLSAQRICVPPIDVDFMVSAIKKLVEIDAAWVPGTPGTSLYIRPFIIATECSLGVHPASNFKFIVIASPSGAYGSGLEPASIMVENKYVRAVKGGTGNAKVIGNYAASLLAQKNASEAGCSQVLWLDGLHHKYVEEVGSMNIFFKIAGRVITPALSGSILPGITRMSVLQLCRDMGIETEERDIDIDEVVAAYDKGLLEECFGTGTAAVISPVGKLVYGGRELSINSENIGELSQRLYDTITGIQYGTIEDRYGWRVTVI